jgi:regulator of sirC expression with transglutaminase-like and TPR domain
MAIELDPELALAHINRAWAYYGQEEWDLALADYSRAIELDPENELVYADRAMVYLKKGDKAAAIADLEMLVAISDNPLLVSSVEQMIDELSR